MNDRLLSENAVVEAIDSCYRDEDDVMLAAFNEALNVAKRAIRALPGAGEPTQLEPG